jgi:glycerol uptake facilitator-like aquaporin
MGIERKLGVEFIGTFFLVLTVGMAVATALLTRVRGGAVLLILRGIGGPHGTVVRCR